jgi:hypothetical protein
MRPKPITFFKLLSAIVFILVGYLAATLEGRAIIFILSLLLSALGILLMLDYENDEKESESESSSN